MLDAHCHIDLYNEPFKVADECERLGIFTIGVTNLPSHFEMGYRHLQSYKKVRLALGMHPLRLESADNELEKFYENISKTSYIGEIGLDFSREGIATKELQIQVFTMILKELRDKRKLLSLHSRKAEKNVLELLLENNISLAIFHWYSGPMGLIDKISTAGFYFSINPAMIRSDSGRKIINRIPMNRILTESDGPFIEENARPIRPKDVKSVILYLSEIHKKSCEEIETTIDSTFVHILSKLNN